MSSASPHVRLSLALITASILLLQLALVRVFDVILAPTTGYMVITSAMFALGLGGIYLYVFPVRSKEIHRVVQGLLFAMAVTSPLVLPVLNALPFELNLLQGSRKVQLLSWAAMYVVLITPFFIGGLIISLLFTRFSAAIHQLYLFDLVGAAIGCLLLIPLLPHFGPGGILFVVSALLILAAMLLGELSVVARTVIGAVAVAGSLYPLTLDNYLEFRGHANKRGNDAMIAEGKRDYVRWDPVSKLDVFNATPNAKLFSLDGGQQGSWMVRSDRDVADRIQETNEKIDHIYHGRSSLVHYLYHGRQSEVLVIGSAVGNETLAALIFGAKHVDAVELVSAMVDAARGRYAEYNGNLFNHPRVSAIVGEGRTFLRGTDKKYDIIQMFSNHTSSSIASGTSAASIAYLQTMEAYLEYFAHLKEDGMLQINRHIYPRMLTTAAQAWHRSGRRDFWRHVMVIERWHSDTLPTLLIKMTPWTRSEVDRALAYMNREPNRGADAPTPVRPSARIFRGHPYRAEFTARVKKLRGLDVLVGTYGQSGLKYDVDAQLLDADGNVAAEIKVPGRHFVDNRPVHIEFPPLSDSLEARYTLVLRSDNEDHQTAFSVWLTANGQPTLQTVPRPVRPSYLIAFDPVNTADNLIGNDFLSYPFPYDEAGKLPYRIDPVTDDSPYFGMIRKSASHIQPSRENRLDRNTAFILNEQLLPFLSADWLHLFVVGVVSLSFALLFVFAPLLASRLGRARWPGMGSDLIYFSCLGAGFIMVELSMIQIFKKLIGFPTHTFTTVVFALLISAGLGSALSKQLRLHEGRRWLVIFAGILICGVIFTLAYSTVFQFGLSLSLAGRIGLSIAFIFPLGLFMGMPFPLGIFHLGRRESAGIPWAWAMNGFFTVFGGFAAILLSIRFNFTTVLFIALAVYLVALLNFARVTNRVGELRSDAGASAESAASP